MRSVPSTGRSEEPILFVGAETDTPENRNLLNQIFENDDECFWLDISLNDFVIFDDSETRTANCCICMWNAPSDIPWK